MRTVLIMVFLAILAPGRARSGWPAPTDTLACTLLDSLPVGGIDLSLAAEAAGAEHQLWGAFANRDLFQRYAQLELPGGASVWPVFRERLLAKAEAGGHGRDTLEAALRQIEQAEPYLVTQGQLMPIGAFVGRCDEGRAWIIPCCWESGHRPPRDGQVFPVRAGHLRVWAIAMASGRQVGFVTCK